MICPSSSARSEASQLEWAGPASVRKSVSIADLLRARQLANAVDEQSHQLTLEAYDVEGRRWNKTDPIRFCVETKKIRRSGF